MSVTDVTSVTELDSQRYLGRWFEIGRLPVLFEDDLHSITTTYRPGPDGTVVVDHRGFTTEGDAIQSLGLGIDIPGYPGRLQVTFPSKSGEEHSFESREYWVMSIDDEYSYALVGTPDRECLWLLAREPQITPAVESVYLTVARHQGFDLTEWIRTHQTGDFVTDANLTI